MSEIVVLKFTDAYRTQVDEIFFETSTRKDFSSPKDREEFHWKYLGFYLSHYPEYAWLAVEDGKLLGYLVGMPLSQDPGLLVLQPHMLKFDSLYQQFPAHLHVNCHAESRGKGVGSVLVQKFVQQLEASNVPGLHIMTGVGSSNRCFYHKLNFSFETQVENILFMGRALQ